MLTKASIALLRLFFGRALTQPELVRQVVLGLNIPHRQKLELLKRRDQRRGKRMSPLLFYVLRRPWKSIITSTVQQWNQKIDDGEFEKIDEGYYAAGQRGEASIDKILRKVLGMQSTLVVEPPVITRTRTNVLARTSLKEYEFGAWEQAQSLWSACGCSTPKITNETPALDDEEEILVL